MPATMLPSSDNIHADELRPDEKQLAGYVAISRLAVAALALGLASPLILVSPLLVVVPLAGVAVATVALIGIAASDGQLKGHWLATLGLCLATLFLGWGVTRQLSRQAFLVEEAERFSIGWLKLVQEGKLREADQLRRDSLSRIRIEDALREHYEKEREAAEELQSFFDAEPLKSFRTIGPSGTFRLVSVAGQSQHGNTDDVALQFEFAASDGNKSDGNAPRQLWITVARTADLKHGTADWVVRSVDRTSPSER
jgi:hypothetical protein